MGDERQSFTRAGRPRGYPGVRQRLRRRDDFARAPNPTLADQSVAEIAAPHQVRCADGADAAHRGRKAGVQTGGEHLRQRRSNPCRANQKGVEPDSERGAAGVLRQILAGGMGAAPDGVEREGLQLFLWQSIDDARPKACGDAINGFAVAHCGVDHRSGAGHLFQAILRQPDLYAPDHAAERIRV